jgi:hypothetical protein
LLAGGTAEEVGGNCTTKADKGAAEAATGKVHRESAWQARYLLAGGGSCLDGGDCDSGATSGGFMGSEMELRKPKALLAGRMPLMLRFCGKVVVIPMYYESGALFISTFKKLWHN